MMKIQADSPEVYIQALPESRRNPMARLRQVMCDHLPSGFEETMNYGMIGYVVPHALYPPGYHCTPDQPLPFISIASQKHFIALYHMGIYSDPELLHWFQKAYAEVVPTKLDMGKSCIRFKNPERIPWDLIAELAGKMTPEVWINRYENALKQ